MILTPLSLLLGYIILNHMSFCRPFLGQIYANVHCDYPIVGSGYRVQCIFQSCWPHVHLCGLVFLQNTFGEVLLGWGTRGAGLAGQQ